MTPDLHAPAAEGSAAGRAGTAVYVYGIVPSSAQPEVGSARGVGDPPAPVRVIPGEGIAALVSDVRAGWSAARRDDVEAHERVLSGAIRSATVVPMRFGVVMGSDEEVRGTLLGRHADEVAELLRQVEGRVQMTLKAFYPEDGLLRDTLKSNPDLKRRGDALRGRPVETTQNERIALGKEVADAVEAQRARDEQMLMAPLARVAVDARADRASSERVALNAQLLVDRDRQGELDAVVQQLTAEHGERFAFRYVGPLAPFSFTSLSLDASEATWG